MHSEPQSGEENDGYGRTATDLIRFERKRSGWWFEIVGGRLRRFGVAVPSVVGR